jgi:hypothetical protein
MDCILNVESLLQLGIFEETYDLYYTICECYESTYCIAKEMPGFYVGTWEKLALKESRKGLDNFFLKNGYLFSQEYPRFHLNVEGKRYFYMLNIKKGKEPCTIDVSIITFKKFLKVLFTTIVGILTQRTRSDKPQIDSKVVESRIEEHFTECVKQKVLFKSHEKESFVPHSSTLIVFKNLSRISCNTKNHSIIPKLITVDRMNDDVRVVLPVHYCETCNRVFVGNQTLSLFEKKYGHLLVDVDRSEFVGYNKSENFVFTGESKLHNLGYNVVRDNYTKSERQKLLLFLYERNKISYFEICRDLENAIRIFKSVPKFENAVRSWQDDLQFINEHCIEQHKE